MEEKELFQELLVRFLDGRLTQEEEKRLLRILKADESNFKELIDIKDIWDSVEVNLNIKKQDTDESLLRLRRKMSKEKYLFGQNNIFRSQFIKIAASLIILFGFTFLFLYVKDRNTVQQITAQQTEYNEIVVPKGQKGQIILGDKTKIWLNGNSTLRYPSQFKADRRDIELEGEAYLEVSKDTERPFYVKTTDLTIKVLGTKFNIKAYQGDKTIETTLIEGAVKILPTRTNIKLQETLLKPNEKATFDKEGKTMVLVNLISTTEKSPKKDSKIEKIDDIEAEVEPIISWKDDKLIFKDESLAEIALKIERWFGVDVEFDASDKKFNSYRYTGKFVYNESIERVMEVISVTTPLHYELDQNKLIIRPK